MKVFISWSGTTSKAVATALHEWLPKVIQAIEPWMSAEDIDKGARWSKEVAGELEGTSVGVLCLTPQNLEAAWILFEAGALSKTVEKTFVCPYLFRGRLSDLPANSPLLQFQATTADKNDTERLLGTINKALGEAALPEARLSSIYEKWWPELEEQLRIIPEPSENREARRPVPEMLEEILTLVRQLNRPTPYPLGAYAMGQLINPLAPPLGQGYPTVKPPDEVFGKEKAERYASLKEALSKRSKPK